MSYNVNLPVTNENGCFEIRLESIGGLGANLCGKMLGELGAVYLDLNAASFSSYGSEKRGSPVKAYIRYSLPDEEIRINSPVENPHILCLFHEAMIGKQTVMAGVTECTKVIVNTMQNPEEIRKRLKMHAGTVCCIDAGKIALERHTRVNTVMLGAIAGVSEFIPLEAALDIVRDTLGKKSPSTLEANLDGVRCGYTGYEIRKFEPDEKYEPEPYKEPENNWGYENAPIGGINTCYGSTVSNDLSASREGYIPIFIKDRCINCGLCDSTCPDMVFKFVPGEYKGRNMMVNEGLDYHYCKGCLRCVEICPSNALVEGIEWEQKELKNFVRNKDLLPDSMDYVNVGANSWMTSESPN